VFVPEIEKLLNEQVGHEFYSAYLYLSMSAWLRDKHLDGYAQWFYVQYKEEMDHGLIMYNYILNAGGQVALGPIEAPPQQFDSVEDVLRRSLEHEQLVTALIYKILAAAHAVNDFKTAQFLDWFVQEQVEEEDNAATSLGRLQKFGGDPATLYSLDREYAARVYAQTPQLALYETA